MGSLLGKFMAVKGYDVVAGYLELGMAEDAISELELMSDGKRKTERYNELLLAAQMMSELWNQAVETAQFLCGVNDGESSYFIHAAFCMHEIGDTEGAKKFLLAGPRMLKKEPLFHYNLACYYAVLGNVESARYALDKAFELDEELREVAARDEDLSILH